jgi:hypothetical protein
VTLVGYLHAQQPQVQQHASPAPPTPPAVGTAVTTAITCRRRAWLAERFADSGKANDKALLGTLLHEAFQQLLAHTMAPTPQDAGQVAPAAAPGGGPAEQAAGMPTVDQIKEQVSRGCRGSVWAQLARQVIRCLTPAVLPLFGDDSSQHLQPSDKP